MNKFTIHTHGYFPVGFHTHLHLGPFVDVNSSLRQGFIDDTSFPASSTNPELNAIQVLINKNASLRVGFGWSFYSTDDITTVLSDSLLSLESSYGNLQCNLVSDERCDWFGFIPYNTFEKSIFEILEYTDLVLFNNQLCRFQVEMIEAVRNHEIYKQHLLLRDEDYRYRLFKNVRKDPTKLSELFHNLVGSLDRSGKTVHSQQAIEELVGHHFLYHPNTFFELLSFYILKGKIHE